MLQELCATLKGLLSDRPELAIFAALIVGYAIGAIKLGPFQLGGVAGTLLAALVIGQIGVRHRSQPATVHVHAVHLRPGLLRRAAILRQRRSDDLDLGPAGRDRDRV